VTLRGGDREKGKKEEKRGRKGEEAVGMLTDAKLLPNRLNR